jgi:hypothetical protein
MDVDQCQIRPVHSSVNRHVLDPSLPESLMVSRLPDWLVGGYRPFLVALRLAARLAPELPDRYGHIWIWTGPAASRRPAGGS